MLKKRSNEITSNDDDGNIALGVIVDYGVPNNTRAWLLHFLCLV